MLGRDLGTCHKGRVQYSIRYGYDDDIFYELVLSSVGATCVAV